MITSLRTMHPEIPQVPQKAGNKANHNIEDFMRVNEYFEVMAIIL